MRTRAPRPPAITDPSRTPILASAAIRLPGKRPIGHEQGDGVADAAKDRGADELNRVTPSGAIATLALTASQEATRDAEGLAEHQPEDDAEQDPRRPGMARDRSTAGRRWPRRRTAAAPRRCSRDRWPARTDRRARAAGRSPPTGCGWPNPRSGAAGAEGRLVPASSPRSRRARARRGPSRPGRAGRWRSEPAGWAGAAPGRRRSGPRRRPPRAASATARPPP